MLARSRGYQNVRAFRVRRDVRIRLRIDVAGPWHTGRSLACPAMQLPPPITRALLIACTVLLFLGAAVRPLQYLEFQWLALFGLRFAGRRVR